MTFIKYIFTNLYLYVETNHLIIKSSKLIFGRSSSVGTNGANLYFIIMTAYNG